MAPRTVRTKASLKAVGDSLPVKKTKAKMIKDDVDEESDDFKGVEITPAEKVKLGRRVTSKVINYNDNNKEEAKPKAVSKSKGRPKVINDEMETEEIIKPKIARGKKALKSDSNGSVDLVNEEVPVKRGKKNNAINKATESDVATTKKTSVKKKDVKTKSKVSLKKKKSIEEESLKDDSDEMSDEDEKEEPVKNTKAKKRPLKKKVEAVKNGEKAEKKGNNKKPIEKAESEEMSDKAEDDVNAEIEESEINDEPPSKIVKKKQGAKVPKNQSVTNYEEIDFTNNSTDKCGNAWNMKISCWNVDGIRAWLGKGGLDFIKYEKPDILCLQETKCSIAKLPEEVASIPGYHPYWLSSDKEGYAGVGLYTRNMAINVRKGLGDPELDDEGRIITAEFKHFYLVCTYVPNAGRKLITLPKRLKWNEAFHKHVKELDKKKPVIICGDMNVAHNEIDLTNPKTNKKNAGFTEEERAGMTTLLNDGFVDTFRHLYPDKRDAYTFWSYMMNNRAKNVGWRLDYFIVSEKLVENVCDNVIRSEVYGSDHCPITLFLHFKTLPKMPTE